MNRTGKNQHKNLFTPEEDATLLRMLSTGHKYFHIAGQLSRTVSSVKNRAARLCAKGLDAKGNLGRPPSVFSEYGGGPIAALQNRTKAEKLIDMVFFGELSEAEAQRRALV